MTGVAFMCRNGTALILAMSVQVAFTHAADWPQFRGPNRDGKSRETGLLKKWPEAGPRLVRTISGLGEGYSSPSIADRCEYRLCQADIHNILARLALDAGDKATARKQATIGRERAECDGKPHWYKPAVDEAERMLKDV